jgi:hypothetical protein
MYPPHPGYGQTMPGYPPQPGYPGGPGVHPAAVQPGGNPYPVSPPQDYRVASGALGFAAGIPAGAATTFGVGAFTAAPLMSASGIAGITQIGNAWQYLDPFSAAMRAGGKAWKAGAGMRGVGGFAARGMGAGLAAAGPALVAVAAAEALRAGGAAIYRGGLRHMHGAQMGLQMGFGGSPGIASTMGGMLDGTAMSMSQSLGQDVSIDDIKSITAELDQQKVFQTVKDFKEFKTRFSEVMGALKTIAKETQSTLEEATRTFGELRQQGFYSTSDITSAAARQHARSLGSGLSQETLHQMGMYGADVARQYGMRGRYGADLASRSAATLASGLKRGTIDEETIEEMGGVESVAARLAQRQMAYLSSSHGTAMIASTMQGGQPGAMSFGALMAGRTGLEGTVTGAAVTGPGGITAARTREAREAYLPYAGLMAMSAAAQRHDTLWGGQQLDQEQMVRMLVTMGWSRDEALMQIQEVQSAPEAIRTQQRAARLEAREAERQSLIDDSWVLPGIGRWGARTMGRPLENFGDRLVSSTRDIWWSATDQRVDYAEADRRLAARAEDFTGSVVYDDRIGSRSRAVGQLMRSAGWEQSEGDTLISSDVTFGQVAGVVAAAALPGGVIGASAMGTWRALRGDFNGSDVTYSRADQREAVAAYRRGLGTTLSDDDRYALERRLRQGGFGMFSRKRGRLEDLASTLGRDWGSMSVTERTEFEGSMASALEGIAGGRYSDVITRQKGIANLGDMSVEEAEALITSGVGGGFFGADSKNLRGLVNTPGSLGGGSTTGIRRALLETDGFAAAFDKLMLAADAGENLDEHLSAIHDLGVGQDVYRTLDRFARQDPSRRQRYAGSDLQRGIYGHHRAQFNNEYVAGVRSAFSEGNITTPEGFAGLQDDLRGHLRSANVPGVRRTAQSMYATALTSGDGIDGKELAYFTEVFGAGGAALASSMQGLVNGGGAMDSALDRLYEGDSEGREAMRASLEGKTGGARQATVLGKLIEQGLLDPALFGDSAAEGGTASPTDYITANTRFVTAVNAFLSRFAGVTSIEAINQLGEGTLPLPEP